jgi:hypothetical protein
VGFGTTGRTGGTRSGNTASALIGTWRNLSTLVMSTGETLVLDVRWQFDAGGDCSRARIQTIVSGNAGTETSDRIACGYTLTGSTMTVSFAGSSVPSRFSVSFAGADLLLAGTRFARIG